MNPVDKELHSFIALGLMIVAMLLISFARTRKNRVFRFMLSFIAFLLFIPIVLSALLAMM